MKICFLSSMHPPKDKRVFDKEAVYLAASGHKVVHVCPGDKTEAGFDRGVQIVTYGRPAGIKGRLQQLFKLYKIAALENADCYHCNEVDSWFIGVLLKILRKSRCVFDVHEHYPSTFAESRFPRWAQPLVAGSVRLVFRSLTPFTDRVVLAKQTVSGDFHCSSEKKVLVRNFTPLSGATFVEDRPSVVAGEQITMVHLGLFNKNRGWPQLLDAMNAMHHKNVRLEVIGEFNDGTRSEFDAVVKAYKLEGRIVVHDWMPFEKAFQYLVDAHIGLVVFQPGILNHVYAMPHKMFDYMAAGLAVICPDFAVEVAPVVQETGCGFLVDTESPKDIANKLDELVDNPALICEMGEKGQQAVRNCYNWEAELKNLLKMYEELEFL